MATNINTILSWFKTGLKPTEPQFRASWTSFWHKDEKIPQSSILDLENTGLTQIKKHNNNNTNNPQSFFDQGYNVSSTVKTDKTGGGQSFSIMNPYRTVLFIEFIG